MRHLAWVLCVLGLAACSAANPPVPRGLTSEPLWVVISLPDGHQARLESLLIRPDRPGRFPLVVLVHGTPADSPANLAGPAIAFAQHGYAAVSILRRGFGRSDGPYLEAPADPCEDTDYLQVGLVSAQDVSGAVASLRREAWADPERVVLLGYSTGGFAVVAAGAANPPGVAGIINVAGGRGAFEPDHVCGADNLVSAYGVLGRSSRTPELWLYSENDQAFVPSLANRMFAAFTARGAPARLQMLPPFGGNGHLLLVAGSTDLWWPAVAAFLESLHLPTAQAKLPPRPQAPLP
ncbi:MAG TPA: alpha/beta fold hydrolase [Stellaceae bacterium]|nr:alpha/beta fold hydrolase [Stellaceae bacterium]